MHITEEVLVVALRKLVEAGLLPRHPLPGEAVRNQQVVQEILSAVAESAQPSIRADAGALDSLGWRNT
jgi:hypothetical protein